MKYLFLLLFPVFCAGQSTELLLTPSDRIFHSSDRFRLKKSEITYDTIPCQILCSVGDSVFILHGFSINRIDWFGDWDSDGQSDKFSTTIKYLDSDMKEIDNHIIWMSKKY